MKWIIVIILAIIGVLAAIVAFEYLTISIHKLPHYLGGKKGRGHYKKRGEGLAVIAVIALGSAGYMAYRIRQAATSGKVSEVSEVSEGAPAASTPADTPPSSPEPAPEAPTNT